MANIYVSSPSGSDAFSGATWLLAKATIAGALAIATAADTIWVSQVHAETSGFGITMTAPTSPGLRILCGNDSAEPPTALATTATVTTTGNSSQRLDGFAYVYGIIFSLSGGSLSVMNIASGTINQSIICESCEFRLIGSSSAPLVNLGPASSNVIDDVFVRLVNCAFQFGATTHTIRFRAGRHEIVNMSLNAGTTPTTLFSYGSNSSATAISLVESSNLSTLAFTNLVSTAGCTALLVLRNCKLPASITLVTGTRPGPGGPVIKLHNCDSADTNYRIAEDRYEGATIHETTIIRTGGASDGTTGLAWKMTSTANTQFYAPLESPEIAIWNDTTGSSKTVTVEIVHDSVTNLKDNEVWLEVQYLGTSGVPQGTIIRDRMTDVLATAADQTASSTTWTTTGLTNPNKQKLAVTFTPQEKGYYLAKVMLAKASYTIYVDPLLTVT